MGSQTFRTLASGEDAELKVAYERFHKMVERAEAAVGSAVLVKVEQLNIKTSATHADVRTGLVFAERLATDLKTATTSIRQIQMSAEGRSYAVLSPISLPTSNMNRRPGNCAQARRASGLAVHTRFP